MLFNGLEKPPPPKTAAFHEEIWTLSNTQFLGSIQVYSPNRLTISSAISLHGCDQLTNSATCNTHSNRPHSRL